MEVYLYAPLFILGACFGSFLCCEARRLRLKNQKKGSEKLGSRSVCLHCGYQLEWYDNIPILSWLLLRGKCRKCHKKIGLAEVISEVSMGLAFLALSTTVNFDSTTPLAWVIFACTLILMLPLGFLAIYDGIYGELPVRYLYISIAISAVIMILKTIANLIAAPFSAATILDPLGSVVILGGLYLILYLVSKGKWVGDGDWLLGVALGLALSSTWLALVVLFIANLLACLVMAPTTIKSKHKKIYFGPFLVIAFVITLTFSNFFYYAIGG